MSRKYTDILDLKGQGHEILCDETTGEIKAEFYNGMLTHKSNDETVSLPSQVDTSDKGKGSA